jgi:hypothetical protein
VFANYSKKMDNWLLNPSAATYGLLTPEMEFLWPHIVETSIDFFQEPAEHLMQRNKCILKLKTATAAYLF